jgi:hypothetical protein
MYLFQVSGKEYFDHVTGEIASALTHLAMTRGALRTVIASAAKQSLERGTTAKLRQIRVPWRIGYTTISDLILRILNYVRFPHCHFIRNFRSLAAQSRRYRSMRF